MKLGPELSMGGVNNLRRESNNSNVHGGVLFEHLRELLLVYGAVLVLVQLLQQRRHLLVVQVGVEPVERVAELQRRDHPVPLLGFAALSVVTVSASTSTADSSLAAAVLVVVVGVEELKELVHELFDRVLLLVPRVGNRARVPLDELIFRARAVSVLIQDLELIVGLLQAQVHPQRRHELSELVGVDLTVVADVEHVKRDADLELLLLRQHHPAARTSGTARAAR
mmetsp:Transcript_27646/g.55678  ORF Transcript_27646/g.55678 Transcript_27646/m.55678 type:complete len:225 (+) Transcript_27646:123-797(+)